MDQERPFEISLPVEIDCSHFFAGVTQDMLQRKCFHSQVHILLLDNVFTVCITVHQFKDILWIIYIKKILHKSQLTRQVENQKLATFLQGVSLLFLFCFVFQTVCQTFQIVTHTAPTKIQYVSFYFCEGHGYWRLTSKSVDLKRREPRRVCTF